ncbi:hypothetical protein GCM10009634_27660 [Saccharothrix xinjiangensis]
MSALVTRPDDQPDDLAGIRADDALLDALGGRNPEQADALVDDELNALLLAWRREVDSRPVGELVDTDTAVATIAAGQARDTDPSVVALSLVTAVLIAVLIVKAVSAHVRRVHQADQAFHAALANPNPNREEQP